MKNAFALSFFLFLYDWLVHYLLSISGSFCFGWLILVWLAHVGLARLLDWFKVMLPESQKWSAVGWREITLDPQLSWVKSSSRFTDNYSHVCGRGLPVCFTHCHAVYMINKGNCRSVKRRNSYCLGCQDHEGKYNTTFRAVSQINLLWRFSHTVPRT